MKFKTILLGSAAALAVSGAQAADLSIAEPVDYVRVCDAFGSGYWYIPGTDTCLKVGGQVEFNVKIHDTKSTTGGESNMHSAAWQFTTVGKLNFTAKSMTEYGVLTGFVSLEAASDNTSDNSHHWALKDTYLELGPVLMGFTDSTFNYGGNFNFDGSQHGNTDVDQVRLSWAMNGFGLMLAVEDPRDNWGSSLDTTYSMPDIVGAITVSQAKWDAKLSAGYQGDLGAGSAWAVQIGATLKLDGIAPGDKLRAKFGYGNSDATANAFLGTSGATGSSWIADVSFQHYWSSTLSTAVSYGYKSTTGSGDVWTGAANLVWAPVAGFEAGVEGLYTSTGGTGAWTGRVRVRRTW